MWPTSPLMNALRLPSAPFILTLLLFSLAAAPALAQSPADTADERAGSYAEDPRRAEVEDLLPPPASLWLTVAGSMGLAEDGARFAGMLMLGGKFDVATKLREVRASEENAKSAASKESEGTEAVSVDAELRATASVPARGALARGAVAAALAASRSSEAESRLDDAATRARASGLVPELRVRVAHVLDEDQSLAPTEYDPDRVTASGGTSLWIEGRATFALDRLVFADDEIAIEKLRLDRAKFERALIEDVLETFAKWQRARAVLDSPDAAADPEAQVGAEIDLAVAEARLDVLTGGWFLRALAGEVAVR